jgi:hypothetical protein
MSVARWCDLSKSHYSLVDNSTDACVSFRRDDLVERGLYGLRINVFPWPQLPQSGNTSLKSLAAQ